MKNADISNCGGDFLLMAIFSKLYNQLVSFPKQLPSSAKKLLLKISQNSKENICGRVVFLKSCRIEAYNSIKKKGSDTDFFLRILQNL